METLAGYPKVYVEEHILLLWKHNIYPKKIKDNLRLCIFTQLLLTKFVFNAYDPEPHWTLPRIQNYVNKI